MNATNKLTASLRSSVSHGIRTRTARAAVAANATSNTRKEFATFSASTSRSSCGSNLPRHHPSLAGTPASPSARGYATLQSSLDTPEYMTEGAHWSGMVHYAGDVEDYDQWSMYRGSTTNNNATTNDLGLSMSAAVASYHYHWEQDDVSRESYQTTAPSDKFVERTSQDILRAQLEEDFASDNNDDLF